MAVHLFMFLVWRQTPPTQVSSSHIFSFLSYKYFNQGYAEEEVL